MNSHYNQERGLRHWLLQRGSAIIMVPLGIWLVVSLVQLPFRNYQTVQNWLGNSLTAGMFAIMMLVTIYHAALGMEQIYKDYVHRPMTYKLACFTTYVLAFGLGAVILLSIYRIWISAL